MSRRNDGLSIAVWENSPWRSFVRCWDPAETSDGQEVPQASHQESDDVREIFGRALDTARSKKFFVSAASVTQSRLDFMRSEARLMAEGSRSWGGAGRSKWGHSYDDSDSDGEAFVGDDDDGMENAADDADPKASLQRIADNTQGPVSRTNSIRAVQSPYSRRGTATGSGAAEDAESSAPPPDLSISGLAASFRVPSRLQIPSPVGVGGGGGSDLLTPTSAGALTRSPQGYPPGTPLSHLGDPAGTGGNVSTPWPVLGSAARVRAARAQAAAAAGGTASSPKLLHLQAANIPVRHSIELHASRKPLSPGAPPLAERWTNTSDGGGPATPSGAAAGGHTSATAAAAMAASGTQDRLLASILRPTDRDRRTHTVTGTGFSTPTAGPMTATTAATAYSVTGVSRGGSGGGGGSGSVGGASNTAAVGAGNSSPSPSSVSSASGGAEQPAPPAQQPHAHPPQRDPVLLNGKSRRAALLSPPDGGAGGGGAGGGKGAAMVPLPSRRLPDPHTARLHPKASMPLAAATSSHSESRLPRANHSYSQILLHQHQSAEARKHLHSPVTALSGDGGRGSAVSTPSSGVLSEGRSIMGRLKGLFAQ